MTDDHLAPASRRSDEHSILERLVQARLEQYPPVLRRWLEPTQGRGWIEDFLREEVERLDSDDLAQLFAHHCPIPAASVDDYKTKWLEVPGLGHALAGIRFWSLDLSRPFVTVVASTRLPRTQHELSRAATVLREAFSVFSPRQLRLFLPPHSPLQPEGEGQYWEKRLHVAPIGELLTQSVPDGYDRVRLEAAPDTSTYSSYRSAFEELIRVSPEHREYTRLESEEDLAELALAGTLFNIYVDGTWAGLTAVDEAGEEGIDGYLMIEILLAGSARGQRLGTAVQRHLIEMLQDKRKLLLGTIDSRNQAAIRAAKRLGRIDLGGYLWLPLKATPSE